MHAGAGLSEKPPKFAGIVLLLLFALASCSLSEAKAGASCHRSTQCQAGLACVQGKCSKDLGPIASESTVPDLGLGEGGMSATMPAAGSGGTGAAMPAAGSGN
jgi:hypothetical protein